MNRTFPRNRNTGLHTVWVAVVWLLLSPAEATAKDFSLPETPAEYEAFALNQHDDLRALHRRWRAAKREAESAADSWPQPRIGYSGRYDIPGFDQKLGRHTGSLSQKFPWPGVLDKSANPARQRATAIRHQFRARVLEIRFDVRQQLIAIAEIDETRAVLEQKARIYRDIVRTVQSQLEANEGDYGDLLRVKTAREKIADELDALASKRKQRVAELRESLDVSGRVNFEVDLDETSAPFEARENLPDRETLIDQARTHHPKLAVSQARAEAKRARAEYAWAKRLPWPTLSVGAQSRPMLMGGGEIDRQTALMFQASIPLPLFLSQYSEEKRRFEHQKSVHRLEKTRKSLELSTRIAQTLSRLEEKQRRLRRYNDQLLPLAENSTQQMLQKIESGERSVTDYLLSFEQQLDLETNAIAFRSTLALERARLEKLTGGAFEAYPNRDTTTVRIEDYKVKRGNNE